MLIMYLFAALFGYLTFYGRSLCQVILFVQILVGLIINLGGYNCFNYPR